MWRNRGAGIEFAGGAVMQFQQQFIPITQASNPHDFAKKVLEMHQNP